MDRPREPAMSSVAGAIAAEDKPAKAGGSVNTFTEFLSKIAGDRLLAESGPFRRSGVKIDFRFRRYDR